MEKKENCDIQSRRRLLLILLPATHLRAHRGILISFPQIRPNSRGILPKNPSTLRIFRTRKCTSYASIAPATDPALLFFISKKFRIPRRGIMDGRRSNDSSASNLSARDTRSRADETTRRMPVPLRVRSGKRFNKLQSSSQTSFDLSPASKRGETSGEERG